MSEWPVTEGDETVFVAKVDGRRVSLQTPPAIPRVIAVETAEQVRQVIAAAIAGAQANDEVEP